MTALAFTGSFAQVDPSHVAAVGPAAAILFARIAWRAQATGEWRATRGMLQQETGLTEPMLRTAVAVLRDREWVSTRRTSAEDATLIWTPIFAGQADIAESGGGVRNPLQPPAESAISSSETGKTTTSPPRPLRVVGADETPERPEVVELCTRLADRIEANGSKRPRITKTWLDECRRLLDLDKRSAEQVARAIDWCQQDTFWRANILSMPTLRKQYDKLRLAAQRDRELAPPTMPPPPLSEPRSWGTGY